MMSSRSGGRFPPPPDAPLLDSVARAWKESVFTPGRFFPQLSREQPLGPSIWYYIALGIIASGITLFWRMVYPAAHLSYHLGRMSGGLQEVQPLQDFLFAPLILIISLFISAGVVHLTLMILRGANSGFATTVRVFCFAYGAQLAVVIPFVGGLTAGIWSVVLAVIGLREAHATTTSRAVLALLLPLGLVMLLGIFAAMMMVMAGMPL